MNREVESTAEYKVTVGGAVGTGCTSKRISGAISESTNYDYCLPSSLSWTVMGIENGPTPIVSAAIRQL